MAAIFNSPSKYIQGPDELAKLGSYVEPLGGKALVIVTPSGKKRVGTKIEGGFAEAKAELLFEDFNGECSKGEVDRLVALARDNGCDIIVGVGGGKILDTAKAVAYYLESPVIICPTIASTDAPCSALSVLYTDDGQFDKYLFLKANPNIVLMDTTVIAASPVRLTVSGMGDALATYFEAQATHDADGGTCAGGKGGTAWRSPSSATRRLWPMASRPRSRWRRVRSRLPLSISSRPIRCFPALALRARALLLLMPSTMA